MTSKLFFLFFLILFQNNISSINSNKFNSNKFNSNELSLRNKIFKDYSVRNRPVIDLNKNINLKYGLEIKSLEYFNQRAENIEFNLWITQLWNDEYLKWNKTEFNFDYINIHSDDIWIPDLELYNAASQPVVYDSLGGLKLFNNGDLLWVRPTTYSFSCMLDLHNFPFDKQKCTMLFGSWKYSARFLDLKPFTSSDNYLNISVDKDFSHNEWNIISTDVEHKNIEYLCCPGEFYPNSFYSIVLKRNYIKYLVVIIMTILITLSSNILLLFPFTNYRRTFVLIFLPLTIIWLQIYISDKIPVIEYYTLMEKILVTCFLITILNAFESSILYCISNENYSFINIIYKKSNRKNIIKNSNIIINNSDNYLIKDTEDNNINNYDNILKHLTYIDNLYKFSLISGYIITLSYLLN
jgi:nicotinic acetylcholine receptor, invertebrate